ncbi:MAG: glucose/mannose transport system permease protein [Psychromonas sp.]|jgi:glucose/mannose transport system permease protein|uniref:carbohydrate ABC transporter permease n=1 Tax=Psychromonas sp. TaxID=1884585 RepID=UPI0039E41605
MKISGAPRQSLGDFIPKLVVAPTFVAAVVFIYGFMLLNAWLSFSSSRMLPKYDWAGTIQYEKLFANDRWWVAAENLLLFGALFIGICLLLGLFLAIFLDQKIRTEGAIRTIYLYPMALSFIVTGTAWKWILNPELGIQRLVREMGFESFTFDWLVNTEMAIYTVVIAGVWQSSGFVMALCLAGLRGVDDNIIKAARVDGASMPLIYRKIIIPGLRPVFFSALIVLTHIAIKSFDLIIALTGGGPGFATDVPATFMYTYSFTRGQIGLGSAASMMMLMAVAAIIVPYLYSELREKNDER